MSSLGKTLENIMRKGGVKTTAIGDLRKTIPHLSGSIQEAGASSPMSDGIKRILQKKAEGYYNPLRSSGQGSHRSLSGGHTNPFKPSQMYGYQNEMARGIRDKAQKVVAFKDKQRQEATRRYLSQMKGVVQGAVPGALIGGAGGLMLAGPWGAAGGAALGAFGGGAYGGSGMVGDWAARQFGVR